MVGVAKQTCFLRFSGMTGRQKDRKNPLAGFLRPIERDAFFQQICVYVRGLKSFSDILFAYFHAVEVIPILVLFIFIAC